MSRVQLAINVSDLTSAIEFYTRLFGVAPAKVRPGYANFAVIDPPLKLVLIEGGGTPGGLNHLGVEVGTSEEVWSATDRLERDGLDTTVENQTTCCHAVQDKVWVSGPDGEPWEIYVVLDDVAPVDSVSGGGAVDESPCCVVPDVRPVGLSVSRTVNPGRDVR